MATDPTIRQALDARDATSELVSRTWEQTRASAPKDALEAVAFWWELAQLADDAATQAIKSAREAHTLRAIGTAAGYITEQAVRRRLAKPD